MILADGADRIRRNPALAIDDRVVVEIGTLEGSE